MSVLAKLLVEIGLRDNTADGLEKSKKGVKEWAGQLRATGTMFTAAVTTPIVGGFAMMVNSASDLAESTSAVEATYGDAADTIIKASEDSANAVGMSQQEYLDSAKSLGVYAKAAGLSGEAMTAFGMDTIGAAADLASFHNADPTEVLDAIKAGLTGETEPLKRFGIMMNEASVQAKAMEMGLVGANGEISEENKILARQQIIMEQLGPASGDFAKTSEGLANQQRILKARLKDVSAQFGKFLLPYMLKGTKIAQKMITWVERLSDRNKKLALAIAAFAAALGPALIALSMMLPALALLVSPIGLIVIALAALGTAYALNLFGFRDAVNGTAKVLWEFIKPIVAFGAALIEAFRSGTPVKDLLKRFPEPIQGLIEPFLLVADAVGDLVSAFGSGGLSGVLDILPAKLLQIGQAFLDLHKAVAEKLLEGLKLAWPYVKEFIGNIPGWAWDALQTVAGYLVPRGKELLQGLWDGIKAKWNPGIRGWLRKLPGEAREALGSVASTLSAKGRELLQGLWDGIKERWQAVYAWIGTIPGEAREAIGSLLYTLKQKGKDLLQGLRDGVEAIWGNAESGLYGWFSGLPDRIGRAVGTVVALLKILKSRGESILQGFRDGVEDKWVGLKAWFVGLPSRALNAIPYLGTILADKGRELIQGLWDGMKAKWEEVKNWRPWDSLPFGIGASALSIGGMGSSGMYASGMNAPDAMNAAPITININGYNRDPNELASAISRELRLAGSSLWP